MAAGPSLDRGPTGPTPVREEVSPRALGGLPLREVVLVAAVVLCIALGIGLLAAQALGIPDARPGTAWDETTEEISTDPSDDELYEQEPEIRTE